MTVLHTPQLTPQQQAEALMFYHLEQAALAFENTGLSHTVPDVFSKPAILAWLSAIEALYPDDEED